MLQRGAYNIMDKLYSKLYNKLHDLTTSLIAGTVYILVSMNIISMIVLLALVLLASGTVYIEALT